LAWGRAAGMEPSTEKLLEALCTDPKSSRERLLHVAGLMFAERGRDAVSTRELTRAAGANLSAIGYYFGSKDGLYNQAIDFTIAGTRALIAGAEARLRADLAAAGRDRRKLARAARAFVRAVLTALLGLGPEHWPRRLIMREIDLPTAAFDRLYQAIFEPLIGAFRALVVAATERDGDEAETTILTNALLGECLIFHRNRPIILRNLDWDEYTPERIALVVEIVVDGILDALDLPRARADGDGDGQVGPGSI
jgi:AcrR family transcriptional regulator